MTRAEKKYLNTICEELLTWSQQAQAFLNHRADLERASYAIVTSVRDAVVDVKVRDVIRWRVLPLRLSDNKNINTLARRAMLPKLTWPELDTIKTLSEQVSKALQEVKSTTGLRRFVSTKNEKSAAAKASLFLSDFYAKGVSTDIPQLLRRVGGLAVPAPTLSVESALEDWLGLREHLADFGDPRLSSSTIVMNLPWAVQTIKDALLLETDLRRQAIKSGSLLRQSETDRVIAEVPIERLKDATRERIRVNALKDVGIKTVQDVFTYSSQLQRIQGVGWKTAHHILGAAKTLWQATFEEMPVRIDVKNPTPQTENLLRSLGAWDTTRQTRNARSDLALFEGLTPLAAALDAGVSHLIVFSVEDEHGHFEEAMKTLSLRAQTLSHIGSDNGLKDPWQDFLSRPADYFVMLQKLGFLLEDENLVTGGLPEDIVEAVRAFELDTTQLTVSLRGYQGFGARFALVQRKVIIGDEMGLGKTIEALAVLTHLHQKGLRHAIVVCPAAVVTNWIREVQSKSTLTAHRLHGNERSQSLRSWIRQGGVAVTTYESLHWLEEHFPSIGDLACVVVDEAHYIKNPFARRTRRTAKLIEQADRAILMTGTPLENRVEEFRNLVSYIRPDLAIDATDLRPRLFRQQVAPVYLRRNQEDVLGELPELVEVDEWLPMSSADSVAYADSVYSGNFQAMRQAAMLQGLSSEKLQRLVEIVDEARENGRKLLIFSHFREVLNVVAANLTGTVIGPLTGSVPAAKRQLMVDELTASSEGAVLVSQIIAGGVGLNIQAASVVIICEPQLKPTTEWQAIARSRRMGQLESVQVHRLLSEEGVDLRVTQILKKKKELFADFAAISETAESAPEAFDISENELVREVVAAERERLFPGITIGDPADENPG